MADVVRMPPRAAKRLVAETPHKTDLMRALDHHDPGVQNSALGRLKERANELSALELEMITRNYLHHKDQRLRASAVEVVNASRRTDVGANLGKRKR